MRKYESKKEITSFQRVFPGVQVNPSTGPVLCCPPPILRPWSWTPRWAPRVSPRGRWCLPCPEHRSLSLSSLPSHHHWHHLGLDGDVGHVPHAVHGVLWDHPGHVVHFGVGVGVDSEVETGHSILKVGQEVLPERAHNSITSKRGLIKGGGHGFFSTYDPKLFGWALSAGPLELMEKKEHSLQ